MCISWDWYTDAFSVLDTGMAPKLLALAKSPVAAHVEILKRLFAVKLTEDNDDATNFLRSFNQMHTTAHFLVTRKKFSNVSSF